MGRLYSNYENQELASVKAKAEELGFTASAFQKYCVMLYLGDRTNTVPLVDLQNKMIDTLNSIEPGRTFIVSALLPAEWPSFSRATKMQLAKFLAAYVKKHPNRFIVAAKVKGTINKYMKL